MPRYTVHFVHRDKQVGASWQIPIDADSTKDAIDRAIHASLDITANPEDYTITARPIRDDNEPRQSDR